MPPVLAQKTKTDISLSIIRIEMSYVECTCVLYMTALSVNLTGHGA